MAQGLLELRGTLESARGFDAPPYHLGDFVAADGSGVVMTGEIVFL